MFHGGLGADPMTEALVRGATALAVAVQSGAVALPWMTCGAAEPELWVPVPAEVWAATDAEGAGVA